MSRIQNEDIKSVSDLTGAGGSKSQLPNDTKVYLSQFSRDKTLAEVIAERLLHGSPLLMHQAYPADAKLYIDPSSIDSMEGMAKTIPPISGVIATVVASTINFQLQSTTGATFSITWPASTVGQFRRLGLTLLVDGSISALFSAEAASVGALVNPGTLFVSGGLPLGYIDLECTHASGKFKTAGSATDIIENRVSGTARISTFGSGGGAGGGIATFALVANANARISSQLNDLIWVVETQTLYVYVPSGLAATVDSKYLLADTSVGAARWKGVAGKFVYQHQGVMRTFALVADINVETLNYDTKLAYVVETDTLYKYVPSAMSSIAVDSLYVLADTVNANARWRGVAGKYIYLNFNQNSYVAKTTNIMTASAGSFSTGHSGTPIVQAWLWDNAASNYKMLDPVSYLVNINSTGTSVDYDFTAATLGGSDFIKLMAIYHDLVSSLSNEFDSGWINKDNINNLPTTGWHRMDLPAGFVAHPAGYTLTFNNGTDIRPGELDSRVIFSLSGATYRIAVDVADLVSGNLFRITASASARPSGNMMALEQQSIIATGTMAQPSGDVLANAAITAPATTTLPAASTMTGFKIFLKNPTAFAWTISSGQNIDGAGSIVLGASNNESTILISTGTTYLRFG